MRGNATALAWLQRGLLAVLGTTLVVVGLQATGNAVATVNVADGTVWLVNPPTGSVVQVSAASEQVTASVRVATAGQPLTGAQDGHSAVVLNRATGEVGRVDGVGLSYGHPTTFPGSSPADLQLFAGPGGAYVVDAARGWVRTLNPADLTTVKESSITTGAKVAEVDADGNLWALDQAASQVFRVTPTGEVTTVEAGGPGASLTLVKGKPYVVSPTEDRVVGLDPDDARVDDDHCLGGGEGQAVLTAGSTRRDPHRRVATLVPAAGDLLTTDVSGGRCTTLSVSDDSPQARAGQGAVASSTYGEPVLSGNVLFIPVVSRGEVIVVDTAENRLIRTIANDELFAPSADGAGSDTPVGKPFELVLDDGNVWFNSLAGPEAGILDRDGVALRVLKYETEVAGKRVGVGAGGVGITDDPSGLQVDVDPAGGDVESDRKSQEGRTGEGEGPGTGGQDGRPGDDGPPRGDAGRGSGSGALDLATSGPLGQSSALTLLPPGAPADVVRNDPTAPPPDVALSPLESRNAAIQSSQAPGQQPAAGSSPTPPPRPSDPTKLQANFSFGPAVVQAGKPVSFVDRSTGSPPPSSWQWDFGDSTTDRTANPTHTYKNAGTYVVTLTVGNGRETARSQPVQISVAGPDSPPVANFTFEPRTGIEVGQPVRFRDASVGDPAITEWIWNWGDGTRSTGANVSHTWTEPNTYQVTLTVRNQYGPATAVKTIDVGNKTAVPKASFTYSPQKVVAGDPVTFTDTSSDGPSGWAWDFGDGGTAASRTVVHRFARPGTYTVRLVTRNSKGVSEPVSQQVAVSAATERPTARFTATRREAEAGQKIAFTSSSLGSPTSQRWDFGDGTGAEGASVDHAWAQPGTYRVTLRVENEAGSDTAGPLEVVITRSNRLVANFTHRPGASPGDAAPVGRPVEFRDESTGTVTSREWDFGDGSRGSGATASHAYAKAGTYKASLKVSDGTTSATITREVFVAGPAVEPPQADFAFSPGKPVAGQVVTFTDRSTNAASWSWEFGDGSSAKAQNPSHTYASKGTYTVTLTVANSSGQTATKTASVTVDAVAKPPPEARFTVSPAEGERTAGKTLTFEDQTSGSVTTPQFTFPDGTVSPAPGGRAVQKAFDRAGQVPVTMKVCWTDDASNCGSVSQTVTILAAVVPPEASFSTGPADAWIDATTAKVGHQVVFTNTSKGEPTRVEWTIGGQSSSGNTATYTASAPGEVAVSLTVTNSAGSSTATSVIRFVDATPPKAAFSANSPVSVGQSVAFTDQSTGRVTAYRWAFGDGETSTEPSPRHAYAKAGTYTVTLTVSNEYGESSATRQITVEAAAQPNPTIEVTPSSGARAGQPVTLRDSSDGAGVDTWEWNFGDGSRGTGQQVSHTWARPGTYTVTLVVSGRYGSATRQATVVVS